MLTKFASNISGGGVGCGSFKGWVMQHNGIFLPVYRANHYQLILLPPSSLRQKIGRISAHLARHCRLSPHMMAPPYVPLAQFSHYERSEEKLADRLRMIAMGYAPIRINLDGFGREACHSFYIDAPSTPATEQLIQLIQGDLSSLLPGNKGLSVAEHLRIPLAVKLTVAAVSRCVSATEGKSFHSRFIADAMLLLKRSQPLEPWQVVERFPFLHLPVQIRQGALFS